MAPPSDKHQLLDLVKGVASLPLSVVASGCFEGAELSLHRWLARTNSFLQHPRIALFASHGIMADNADRAAADGYLETCLGGQSTVCEQAENIDADLRIYELGDSGDDAVLPMAYGMMAVEPGIDMLVVSGFGGGLEAVSSGVLTNLSRTGDAFNDLNCAAMAASAGAILAARLAAIPVILDNAAAVAALAVLCRINPAMADHCATGWAPPPAAKQWFRDQTTLQFLPSIADALPGLNGCAILQRAMALSRTSDLSAAS